MKKMINILLCCFPVLGFCQPYALAPEKDTLSLDLATFEKFANLYEVGLEMTGDSLKVGKEFQKVLADESYRCSDAIVVDSIKHKLPTQREL